MTDSADKRLHIVLLNQAFHPDVVATAQMGKDLADALVHRGHKVSAIASRSIYGQKGAALPKRESLTPRPLAANPGEAPAASTVTHPMNTIEVHRVGMSVFGKAGYAARIADFALFYLLATFRLLTLPRPDVVICYTTPPFIALAGILSRWLRGSRAVYWVMDLYPDLPVACGVMKPRALPTRFFERVNRFILRHSNLDVVLGRCMRDRVLSKGTPSDRVRIIPVWADLAGIEPVPQESNPYRTRWAPQGQFLVVYSGNFGIGHDARTIIDSMKALKDDPSIRFVFVGGGKRRKEVEAAAQEHNLPNAIFEDYVPREELSKSLSAADLHLISLREGVEGIMVPSKMYGIMAVARPSLFVGRPTSEIARVLDESGSGLTIREGDAQALTRAILDLKNDPERRRSMGEAGRAALTGRYDARTACAQWIDVIESLVDPANATPKHPSPQP